MKKDSALLIICRYLLVFLVFGAIFVGQPNFAFSTSSPPLKKTTTVMPSGNTITSIEADGNLEVEHKLQCMPLQSVKPEYTPADIHGAIIDCIKKEKYQEGLDLFRIAGSYVRFDIMRVVDKTAHQAGAMLSMKTGLALSEEERKKWEVYAKKHISTPPDDTLCQNIKKLGPPVYYPRYMIQHGMGAILGDKSDPLVKNFDAENAWHESLKAYLHCNL